MVLALDTCLGACSVAIADGDHTAAWLSEAMARGHQERLALMVRDVMGEARLAFGDLDRIGVTVGPGSFTGLRVGLAFAKGLALALDRPCVGVGALEALAASAGSPGICAAVIDAGRGRAYLQLFEAGRPLTAPDILPLPEAAERLARARGDRHARLVGPGAALLAPMIARAEVVGLVAPSPATVARLAADVSPSPPRPLYLRAPDARPKTP
ncbi:MAG: tRNA (adenosine(37)-N6)-threonylcarbamoyltransferase complex dimerization subunit type 1 TsaB [Caulobacteraceae bacterium]|nr:tRNA (adenosine(37)-N6)-threonylcarbamoyltransferase complex dimerization subunit type 1 TsaB [Caulobacteraceae bacterium]